MDGNVEDSLKNMTALDLYDLLIENCGKKTLKEIDLFLYDKFSGQDDESEEESAEEESDGDNDENEEEEEEESEEEEVELKKSKR
jgi:hypothetical protein